MRIKKDFNRKNLLVVFSIFILCFIVVSSQEEISYAKYEETEALDPDNLEGLWIIGAIDYGKNNDLKGNSTIDINESKDLSDLYDGYSLTLNSDGTFVYKKNIYFDKGSYEADPTDSESYILKTDKSYRLSYKEGEIVQIETDSKVDYILEVCIDSLHLHEYDISTGKAKEDGNGFYFVKSEEDGEEIQAVGSVDDKESINKHEYVPNSSYEDILYYYTSMMEDTVPTLIDEYYRDAYGISDIEQLAEICNEKVSELAEICNEGIEKMADLMYEKNDSYETYSDWSNKLMNNYIEISQGIQDAYLDSVM